MAPIFYNKHPEELVESSLSSSWTFNFHLPRWWWERIFNRKGK